MSFLLNFIPFVIEHKNSIMGLKAKRQNAESRDFTNISLKGQLDVISLGSETWVFWSRGRAQECWCRVETGIHRQPALQVPRGRQLFHYLFEHYGFSFQKKKTPENCISFLLERQIRFIDRKGREKDLSTVSFSLLPPCPTIPSELSWTKVRSRELLLGLPPRCRFPRIWAKLDHFPRPQTESWVGNWAIGIRTSVHTGSWHVQGKFSCQANRGHIFDKTNNLLAFS